MSKAEQAIPAQRKAQLFAALGDSKRLELIERMGSGGKNSIVELSTGMGLSRQGVTKHLRVLELAGIVKSTRVGRELHFLLTPAALTPLQEYLKLVSERWDDTIERLRAFVEEEHDGSP